MSASIVVLILKLVPCLIIALCYWLKDDRPPGDDGPGGWRRRYQRARAALRRLVDRINPDRWTQGEVLAGCYLCIFLGVGLDAWFH